MRSIQKVDQNEKEVKLVISSLKNVLTDVPYDFEYEEDGTEEGTQNKDNK